MKTAQSAKRLTAVIAAFTVGVCLATPIAAAELYRWTDEQGVVNYSNSAPPKTRGGKGPTVVEDRVSVYTPERSVTEAIERSRERRPPPAPAASFTRPPEPERRAVAPPPAAYDPCLQPGDPNCQGYLYDSSPVFNGRRRHTPLVQPQLQPGTIAGQSAASSGYIPGQSGAAIPPATPPRSSGTAGFTMRGNEREREYPRR